MFNAASTTDLGLFLFFAPSLDSIHAIVLTPSKMLIITSWSFDGMSFVSIRFPLAILRIERDDCESPAAKVATSFGGRAS